MKKDEAYRYIKNLIIQGKWHPEKSINVTELGDYLNMSRTPIHRALSQLAEEGYLDIIPQVGVFVKRPDPKEVLERVYVCANLDALMTEEAARLMNKEDLAYLEKLLQTMDNPHLSPEDYAALNIKFHKTIYHASGYSYTIKLAKQLWDYLNYLGTPELLFISDRRKRSQVEHWLIYYALKDKNSKLAKELVELHMRRVADVIDEVITKSKQAVSS
ncbi:DNA-binding GntR family transcriptional regulator [Evansella vedderi]|uniref:DNA-binding GntR family transcriptional regulator n=1 Tax=Evansella vedderi TaxID=38282 RepID=A0ABU0A376_9BACI|nr:GntR family transcriptional regulator [Evansella vedderi]MDQ0257108.1 DNA-binding GntR family transcriptional regulator [Evansella vedderi]